MDRAFSVGDCIGDMHLHTPQNREMIAAGWSAGRTFEISRDMAFGLLVAAQTDMNGDDSKLEFVNNCLNANKNAFIISVEEDHYYGQMLVVYQYDHRFYLTPLTRTD